MTMWNFYFQIFEKAVAKEQVVEFLANLVQQIAGPMLIIWDRLPAHRSRLVAEFVEFLEGHIVLDYLPPYAPELNPVEYLWGHWKHHELPNVCPRDLWQLTAGARRTLSRLRRPSEIDHSFLEAGFFIRMNPLYYAEFSNMPSADFCSAVRPPFDSLSRRSDTEQISWGKLNRLPCTAAGSTLRVFDGYGLRGKLPARPTLTPCIRFLSIDSHF